jgi:ParB-like chromosome segregation protein Spo0J
MKVSALTKLPGNPRRISKGNLKRLEQSLEKFGYVQPIVVNEKTGHIVAGHQRLRVLKKAKVRDVDVAVIKMTERRERALSLALNSAAFAGEFTDDLDKWVAEISKLEPDTSEMLKAIEECERGLEEIGKTTMEKPALSDVSEAKLNKFIQSRENSRAAHKDVTDVNFYLCVVFQNVEQKMAFLKKFPMLKPRYNMYVDGEIFAKAFGVGLPVCSQKYSEPRLDKTLERATM